MRKSLKFLLSLFVIVTLALSSMSAVYADSGKSKAAKNKGKAYGKVFKDLKADFWAYSSIQDLVEQGVLNGFPNGFFKPNEKVTRSQFAAMLANALKLTFSGNTQTFADVPPASWDYKAVEASKDYLTGYSVNGVLYFYGSRSAVREDMAVALVRALKIALIPENGQLAQVFSDYTEISQNLKDYVYTAYKSGLMQGSDGKFKPQGSLTRAESATLLDRALKTVAAGSNDPSKVIIGGSGTGTVKDSDATLSGITVNGAALSGFTSGTLTYNIILPSGTTALPVVAATVTDTGKAAASITQASVLPGAASIIVTAEDQTTRKAYTINFSVAPAPKSNNATLSNITVNGFALTGFNSNTLTYNMIFPAGTTTIPVVAAIVADAGKASAVVTQAPALPGTATILVTAEDQTTKKTYTINFSVAAQ